MFKSIYAIQKGVIVPDYKLKRLSFGADKTFWKMWDAGPDYPNGDEEVLIGSDFITVPIQPWSLNTLVCKLATRMSLARFNQKQTLSMLMGWHKKHDLFTTAKELKKIIAATKEFTAQFKREQKCLEMRRYRAKKKEAALSNLQSVVIGKGMCFRCGAEALKYAHPSGWTAKPGFAWHDYWYRCTDPACNMPGLDPAAYNPAVGDRVTKPTVEQRLDAIFDKDGVEATSNV
jgi:hypothetical protein